MGKKTHQRAPIKENTTGMNDGKTTVLTESQLMDDQRQNNPDNIFGEKSNAELAAINHELREELKAAIFEKEQMRRSEQLVKMVFDGTTDALILLTPTLRIKMANLAVYDYAEIDKSEAVLNKPCYWLLCGELGPCENCVVIKAISSDKTIMEEREYPDALGRVYMHSAYPLKNENGDLEGAVLRISDITERKLLEKHLTQSEKLSSLGLLVSSIAHEINNPNSFIALNIPILKAYMEAMLPIMDRHAELQSGLEMMNMPYDDFRKDIFSLLDNMDHGAAQIGNIVSALGRFSRVNSQGKQEWVDLNALIDRVLAICGNKVNRTVKSFIKDIPLNLPDIYTNPDYLEQIIVNLLINASDACNGKNSCVRLGTEVKDSWLDHAIIEVTDNGCGMDEKTLEKIFTPFFTTKPQGKGTGLGLYICNNLVEGLYGRIEVESHPGAGSTFRVILPDKERRKKERLI